MNRYAAWLACLDGIDVWYPTMNADGTIRDGAWVAEATGLLELSEWPAGSRVILRKERPHPGAQLTFLDVDGHRITAFITDTRHQHVKSTARRVTESDLLEQAAQIVGALLEFILSVAHCDRAATLCTIT